MVQRMVAIGILPGVAIALAPYFGMFIANLHNQQDKLQNAWQLRERGSLGLR